MSLNKTQKQLLANGLRGSTVPEVVAAVNTRDDIYLTTYCNLASTSNCWNPEMTSLELFTVSPIPVYRALDQGQRDSWQMMLDFAPQNFASNKRRKDVTDTWGLTESIPVLQGCQRKATNGELYLGSSTVTENTVSTLKLNTPGQLSVTDISDSLNSY